MTFDLQNVNDDIISMKRTIKQMLISNVDLLEALNNKDIPIDSPDEYLDSNIYDFLRVPRTQDTVRNFICFTVDDIEDHRFNEAMKIQYIQINVICHLEDMSTRYGMSRHDLLGYLIREKFNWTNLFGLQFKLVYNKESPVDSDYYCRTLKFEAVKPNSLDKSKKLVSSNDKLRR